MRMLQQIQKIKKVIGTTDILIDFNKLIFLNNIAKLLNSICILHYFDINNVLYSRV